MTIQYKNSSQKGNAGLGIAIGWFATQGYPVLVPLTDTQPYDLVIDQHGSFKTVQVKMTLRKNKSGRYLADLRRNNGRKSHCLPFDNTAFDYVFVVDGDGNKYLIPSLCIKTSVLTLSSKYKEFKIGSMV